jgi:DNA repair protein RadC
MEDSCVYPEATNGGNLVIKRESIAPIDCQRVVLQRTGKCPKVKIGGPSDVVQLLKEMQSYDRERGIILDLDTKNYVVGIENISTGSINASIIHPREAVKGAILVNAAHCIFVHNHPSGDSKPSIEDENMDTQLKAAFDIVGIDLLDSIIIGKDSYYSRRETIGPFKSRSGGIKYMEVHENSEKVMEKDGNREDDACTVASEAAMSVLSEQCSDGDGKINNPIQAAMVAKQYLAEQGKDVLLWSIKTVNKVDDDNWEVIVDCPKFKGKLKVTSEKVEIVEEEY